MPIKVIDSFVQNNILNKEGKRKSEEYQMLKAMLETIRQDP
jgi:hypothetical protein